MRTKISIKRAAVLFKPTNHRTRLPHRSGRTDPRLIRYSNIGVLVVPEYNHVLSPAEIFSELQVCMMKVTRSTIADEHGFSMAVQPQFLTFHSQAFADEVIQEKHLGSAQLRVHTTQAHRQLCKHIHTTQSKGLDEI